MNYDITALRAGFAFSLKYHPFYGLNEKIDPVTRTYTKEGMELFHLWETVLKGDFLPAKYSLQSVCGDIFASCFNEMHMNPEKYWKIAGLFFSNLGYETGREAKEAIP